MSYRYGAKNLCRAPFYDQWRELYKLETQMLLADDIVGKESMNKNELGKFVQDTLEEDKVIKGNIVLIAIIWA